MSEQESNPNKPAPEKFSSGSRQPQHAQDIPELPLESQLSAEDAARRKTEAKQIEKIRSSLDLEAYEDSGSRRYERAESFTEGVALLGEKIGTHLAENKSILVAISGKTGSGKTSLANEVRRRMAEQGGVGATIVSTDNFYLPRSNEIDTKKLHATIDKLQSGESVGNLAPAKIILIEGLQTVDNKTVGQKPDVRVYMDAPAEKRFATRLLRDERIGLRTVKNSLKMLAELTPETVAAIEKFEIDPSMKDVDLVVNNAHRNPDEPELYISGNILFFSSPDGISETVEITSDKISFLEQVGIQKK